VRLTIEVIIFISSFPHVMLSFIIVNAVYFFETKTISASSLNNVKRAYLLCVALLFYLVSIAFPVYLPWFVDCRRHLFFCRSRLGKKDDHAVRNVENCGYPTRSLSSIYVQ
jgi:hypothetical protein